MQETILGELIYERIHAGPVFALARIQENIFEEVFPEYCAKFLGEFIRCEYTPRLYSHPREYRKIFLANYLCIGFVPGGTSAMSVSQHVLLVRPQDIVGDSGSRGPERASLPGSLDPIQISGGNVVLRSRAVPACSAVGLRKAEVEKLTRSSLRRFSREATGRFGCGSRMQPFERF